jgi:hypothetical protein
VRKNENRRNEKEKTENNGMEPVYVSKENTQQTQISTV